MPKVFYVQFSRCIYVFSFLLLVQHVQAQQAASIKTVIDKAEGYNQKMPVEKVYLQFDKPYYAVGDTMWFKGYITSARLNYSPLSSKLYVDLVNDSSKVVKHYAFAAALGMCPGNIILNDGELPQGVYTVRAYTNWMRNLGPDYFFYQSFYITNNVANAWLINTKSTYSGNRVKVGLSITDIYKRPLVSQDLLFKVVNGKRTIARNAASTGPDGTANLDFDLPDNGRSKNLMLIASDKKDQHKTANIPLDVERPVDVDVQFMPEGGFLVAGLPVQVGFKAIGQDGRGVNVKGIVTDKENNTAGKFETTHAGMGAFVMAPQPNEVYTAKLTLPNGTEKVISLPPVKPAGMVLKVRNALTSDSLEVTVLCTADFVSPDKAYFLLGQSRGVVCYGAAFKMDKQFTTVHVSKSLFPTGVAHFTVLNNLSQPLNERLVFVNHHDELKVDMNTPQSTFAPRDSIALQLNVADGQGTPVVGSFSVAVTDDAQVKQPADGANIETQLLLTADLKGYVENPAYYLGNNADAWKALDALLLTQGWIGYDWKSINAGLPKTLFAPEPENAVSGKVTNLLNKPIAGSKVLLLSTGKYQFLRDTTTNTDGQFYFRHIPVTDSVKYVLSARNGRGRTINGGITVDDAPALSAALPYDHEPAPWYVNSDTTLLNYIKTNAVYQQALEKRRYGGRLLRDVNVRDRASVRNSQNLNGAGNADQTITEAEIEKAGKATLLDVIQQKVTGFHATFAHKSTDMEFFVKDKRVRFVIDGIDLDRFYTPFAETPNEHYQYQKQTLDYLTAEDILGIEVLYSGRYNSNYNAQNLSVDDQLAINPAGPRGSDVAYLEITTRSGNGPFTRTATGIYVYKPAPITIPRQFYRPRYPVKNIAPGFTDVRSTIHWAPNVITDKTGKATVSFYAADKPATYTVILEGSDLNGKVGYQTRKITVGSVTQ